jgi:hypothetical protein
LGCLGEAYRRIGVSAYRRFIAPEPEGLQDSAPAGQKNIPNGLILVPFGTGPLQGASPRVSGSQVETPNLAPTYGNTRTSTIKEVRLPPIVIVLDLCRWGGFELAD